MDTSNDFYCSLPFRHLTFLSQPNQVAPCCLYDAAHTLRDESTDDIFANNYFSQLRESMLSGKADAACFRCYDIEKSGVRSYRQKYNQLFGHVTDTRLEYLELNLGNLCNLKCRMCDSVASTKWMEPARKLGRHVHPLFRRTLDDIQIDVSALTELKFLGGEPSLEQETMINVLSKIKDARGGLSHLAASVTTNGMVRFTDEVLELLDECQSCIFMLSVDGIGAVNDYQRVGCQWDVLAQNICHYDQALSQKFNISFCTTIGLINANGMIDLINWTMTTVPRVKIWGNLIYEPDFLSMRNLPQDFKLELKDRLQSYTRFDQRQDVSDLKKLLISQLDLPPVVDIQSTLRNLLALDEVMEDSLLLANPELHAVLARTAA